MLVFAAMLAGCAQCSSAGASTYEAPGAALPLQTSAERALQVDERLAPFQRRTLKPFSTDLGLQRYLEALGFVRDASWQVPLPQLPPAGARALHASAPLAGELVNRAAALPRTLGPLTSLPGERRLARHGAHALLLYQNELRSFTTSAVAPWIVPRARLALGPPFPELRAPQFDVKGERRDLSGVDPDALAGVALFDHVLVGPQGEAVVVGRRLDTQAIELVFLAIAPDGALSREATRTIHYRHADHESTDVRVVGGAVVLYLQHDPVYETLPSVPSLSSSESMPAPLLRGEDVQYPLYPAQDTVLHTLVRCTFPSAGLACSARAIPAAPAHHVALSDDAAYAWLLDWHGARPSIRAAYLYRMPFDGSAPTAVRTRAPFRDPALALHADAEHVRALVPSRSHGVDLLDVPVTAFSARAAHLPAAHYRRVAGLDIREHDGASAQLVGQHWLVRHEPLRGSAEQAAHSDGLGVVHVVALDGSDAARVPLDHTSSRLTPLGDHALLTGSDGKDLRTSLVALSGATSRLVATQVVGDAARTTSAEAAQPLRFDAKEGCLAESLRDVDGDTESLLPLHWDADAGALEASPPWRVSNAHQPRTQPPQRDVLALSPDLTLMRVQAELLALRCAPRPELARRLALGR